MRLVRFIYLYIKVCLVLSYWSECGVEIVGWCVMLESVLICYIYMLFN